MREEGVCALLCVLRGGKKIQFRRPAGETITDKYKLINNNFFFFNFKKIKNNLKKKNINSFHNYVIDEGTRRRFSKLRFKKSFYV